MAEKKTKTGRPKKIIEWDKALRAAEIFCTQEEISYILGISVDTLAARCKEENGCSFSEYINKGMNTGKESLRRAQFDAATKKLNPLMLMWMGKQYLNQKDKHEIDLNTNLPSKLDEKLDRLGEDALDKIFQ